MRHQPFEIPRDGLTLRGMLYRPDDDRRHPAVVLMHGFTGQRMESGYLFVQLARTLAERGLAAVTFDFLHCGESDGAFERMLVSGQVDDALSVTAWTQRHPHVDRSRLGVVGFSLGGLVAGCAQGRSDAYRAAALLAPTTSENLARYAQRAADDGQVTVGPHTLHPRFFDDLLAHDPATELAAHPLPTLLVQGTDDAAVPPTVSRHYADALEGAGLPPARLDIAGADHSFTQPTSRRRVVAAVAAHLAEHLLP